ncbi:PilZ domain-containing protein [Prosthecomicrobium sp. N25]|uniref:PilZ domain-containing protein n=1 Tax=Prosthecomicrobium sp. N25 TaxID=3129254 RepID=UPI003077DCD3
MSYADLDGHLQDERRDGFRRRTLLRALAVLNNGYSTFDATIRNLSVTGAKLELARPTLLPIRFELRYDNIKRWVRVVWRDENRLGVAFD